MFEREITDECKYFITHDNLESLKELYEHYYTDSESKDVAWDVVFKDIYIHACLKKRKDIVEWLDEIYKEFDPIIKIGLRQMFPYAKYLYNKK